MNIYVIFKGYFWWFTTSTRIAITKFNIVIEQIEIKQADEVQIDGDADVTMKTDNLVVGATGDCKGTIETHNADIWGAFDGDIKASGTLTIQEQGKVSGKIEYQNLQIKLGGQISGDIKLSDKIQSIKKDTKPSEDNNISLQESIKKD